MKLAFVIHSEYYTTQVMDLLDECNINISDLTPGG